MKKFKFPILKIVVAIAPDLVGVVNAAIIARNNDSSASPISKPGKIRVWSIILEVIPEIRPIAFQIAAAKADGIVTEGEIAEIAAAVAIAIAVPLATELERAHGSKITSAEWEIIAADAASRLVPKIVKTIQEANA